MLVDKLLRALVLYVKNETHFAQSPVLCYTVRVGERTITPSCSKGVGRYYGCANITDLICPKSPQERSVRRTWECERLNN